MSLIDFFSQIDTSVLTISGIFYGVYATIHFGLFVHVGDLADIRRRFIYNTYARAQDKMEIIEFINCLCKRSKVLVTSPQRRYWPFRLAIWSFGAVSLVATICKPLSSMCKFLDRNLVLYAYTFSLAVAIVFVCVETRFFLSCQKLQKSFPGEVPHSEEIILVKKGLANQAMEPTVTSGKRTKPSSR